MVINREKGGNKKSGCMGESLKDMVIIGHEWWAIYFDVGNLWAIFQL